MTLVEKTCPMCGAILEIKQNPKTLKEFLGCSNYRSNPQCMHTEPLPLEIWLQREPWNEDEYEQWKRIKDKEGQQ